MTLVFPNIEAEQALRGYRLHLGLAFQLIDDVLDYEGTTEGLGKNVGDDFAEGKVTLPLIVAMRNEDEAQRRYIRGEAELLDYPRMTSQITWHGGVGTKDLKPSVNRLGGYSSITALGFGPY
jgi:geranylgeranyl pyrophosphate synthase